MAWSKMVDLAYSDDEKIEQMMPIPMDNRPDYPCGHKIVLTRRDFERMELDCNCNVGDVIDLRAFAVVTSISKNDADDRVELQIEKLAYENEMTEATEPDDE